MSFNELNQENKKHRQNKMSGTYCAQVNYFLTVIMPWSSAYSKR